MASTPSSLTDRRRRRGAFLVGLLLALLFFMLIGGLFLLHLAPSHWSILTLMGLSWVIASLGLGFLVCLQTASMDPCGTLASRLVMLARTLEWLAASSTDTGRP